VDILYLQDELPKKSVPSIPIARTFWVEWFIIDTTFNATHKILNVLWFSYDYCHLVLTVSAQQNDSSSCHHCQHQQSPSINHFSKDNLRQLLVDMLQVRYSFIYKINFLMFFFLKNDEEFVTGLHNAYIEKQTISRHIYS